MSEKLEYLNKYKGYAGAPVEIVSARDVSEDIPESWAAVFALSDQRQRIDTLVAEWVKYVPSDLRRTIHYLLKNIAEIDLIRRNEKLYILYSIQRSKHDKITYYEGGNPKDSLACRSPVLAALWSGLPNGLRRFYEHLHNGFHSYTGKAMGLNSTQDAFVMNEYDWGVIDDLGITDIPIDFDTSFAFFDNGGGGHVVLDLKQPDIDKAVLWFSGDTPEYNLNFWDIVDEWIVIGFE